MFFRSLILSIFLISVINGQETNSNIKNLTRQLEDAKRQCQQELFSYGKKKDYEKLLYHLCDQSASILVQMLKIDEYDLKDSIQNVGEVLTKLSLTKITSEKQALDSTQNLYDSFVNYLDVGLSSMKNHTVNTRQTLKVAGRELRNAALALKFFLDDKGKKVSNFLKTLNLLFRNRLKYIEEILSIFAPYDCSGKRKESKTLLSLANTTLETINRLMPYASQSEAKVLYLSSNLTYKLIEEVNNLSVNTRSGQMLDEYYYSFLYQTHNRISVVVKIYTIYARFYESKQKQKEENERKQQEQV